MITEVVFNISDIPEKPITLIGNGQKKLLVVCENEDFSEFGKSKLSAILKAIKYDMEEDVYVCIVDKQTVNISTLDIHFTNLLLFGITPDRLGFNIQHKLYNAHYFENFVMVVSESIMELETHVSKKKELWKCLQTVFLNAQ